MFSLVSWCRYILYWFTVNRRPGCVQISWTCYCQDLTSAGWRVWFWSN